MTGRTIAHYEILDKLGGGGTGVVYKARDTHLDRFVAVKVLRPDRMADAERKRRFIQEAKAASALNHPNIITVHDIDTRDGIDYIVMEYVAGKPLDELIPRKGMRLNEALKVAVQIADALAAAHEAGIVHRDLKPGNVMVSEKGQVKVVDFGLAKLAEAQPLPEGETVTTRLTDENTIIGSVNYMSPEQAQGLKVEARSDIFSFGAVLYEMVMGRQAFQGDSKMATLGAIIHKDPAPFGTEIPHDLERIITRCLRKDPARRIQTMGDLKVALEEQKEESESGRLAAAHPAPRRLRRKLLIWPAAIVLLLGVGAVVYLRLSSPPLPGPLEAVPLTTYPGSECCGSFSPDGSQVAFSWNGEKQDNFDIYIQVIGTGKPLRRTTDPAREVQPAWSPDGRFIAFLRERGEKVQIVRMPALSGSESILAEASSIIRPQVWTSLSWTPDSQWLAYANRDSPDESISLFAVSAEGGEPRRLTRPPPNVLGDSWPAFSPDGRALAFIRGPTLDIGDLYVLGLSTGFVPQGEPARLTFGNTLSSSPAWTTDGRDVIYAAGPLARRSLWRIAARGRPPGGGLARPERLALPGETAGYPAVSSFRRRLMFTTGRTDVDIWRVDLGGAGKPPSSRRLVSSTYADRNPQLSPDGRRIVFVSTRSGRNEIWVCDREGEGEEKLTSMEAQMTGSPRWSPDGEWIVYDSNAEGQFEVYIVSAKGGRPRRLTTDRAIDAVASWSRDGKRIYFVSNRSGRFQVWGVPAEGGNAVQITRNGGYLAFESWDGKSLYYTITNSGVSGLFHVPIEGGGETKVVDAVVAGNFAVAADGIYFIPPADIRGGSSIQFFEFSTGKTELVAVVENPSGTGLSASPDGRSFLYNRGSHIEGDLMLVENFR